MDGSKILKIGLLAGAGYIAYRTFFSVPGGTHADLVKAGGLPPGSVPGGGLPAAPAVGPVSTQSLDSIYSALVREANPPAEGLTVDAWNWFLQYKAEPKLAPLPDPGPIFQASDSGFKRESNMTASQYWAVMAPYLRQHYGLSGMAGLGIFGMMALGRRGGW